MADYQLADQFLYQNTLSNDTGDIQISKNKRIVYVSDQNNGNYQSGMVEIDAKSSLQGANGFGSLRDSYIVSPYPVSMANVGGVDMLTVVDKNALTLKCGIWNLVSSMSAEIDGKTILTDSEFKMFWNNIRAQTEWTKNDVDKHAADCFISPDSWYSIGFGRSDDNAGVPAETEYGDGFINNGFKTGSTMLSSENKGFSSRVYNNPSVVAKTDNTPVNDHGWPTTRSSIAKTLTTQLGQGAFQASAVPAVKTGGIMGVWYYMVKLRLVDLHPIFKDLNLLANPSLKITLRMNRGYVDIDTYASNKMSLKSATFTAGNVCPVQIASAASGNPMNGVFPATSTVVRIAFGPITNEITTSPPNGFYPFTNARLYIPFYDIKNPSAIVAKPIKQINYLDCYAQYFRKQAGIASINGQQNADFTLQLSGSHKAIKYVCVLPFSETSDGHWKNADNTEQFASPFDSAPWTLQPGSAIRNFNIRVGNEVVFSKQKEFDWEMYRDEITKVMALNGGLTHEISNGLLDAQAWANAHRFMIADCSRVSNKDVPQTVVVSGTNVCSQGSNLLVLVIYERNLSINLLTSEVQTD